MWGVGGWLADWGANVIKIESPAHIDTERGMGGARHGPDFQNLHRNKRSMTLNLKSEEGLEILKKLIAKGDVLVDNFKTGTLSRWGLDYETLQEIRPGLIYCTVTGYGYTGPYSSRPGYDLIVQATGGFMSITGPENGDPSRAGVAIADISTGMFAANAILAALYSREQTGKGQRIDMSLLDSQVALLSYAATNYFVSGSITNRLGNAHPNIVPYQSFKARDMHFVLAVGNDKQWEIFCKSINKPEWVDDEKYSTNALRVNNRKQLIDQLSKLFATQNAGYWLEIFDKVGLPSGPINELDKVFENEQIKSREMQIELPHSIDNKVTLLNSPIKIPTSPTKTHKAPPTLGEHTEEILKEKIGLDQDTVARLRDEGIL